MAIVDWEPWMEPGSAAEAKRNEEMMKQFALNQFGLQQDLVRNALGLQQCEMLGGLDAQRQGALQGLGLGAGLAGMPMNGPAIDWDGKAEFHSTGRLPTPHAPWSRIWRYAWPLLVLAAYMAAVWGFCVWVK